MGLATISYHASMVRRVVRAPVDIGKREAAIAAFDAGEVASAFGLTLSHVVPEVAPHGPWRFVQGTSVLHVTLNDDVVLLRVPLVKLADNQHAVAAMRYLLTNVASAGQLGQPRLRADEVTIEYSAPLSQLHPDKLLELLHTMPSVADLVDDWLVAKFGAHPLERAPVTPLSEEEFATALAFWTTHWQEIDALVDEVQKRRSVWLLNEATALAVHRIRFTLPLMGYLAARLTEAAAAFNADDQEPKQRDAALAKFVREMLAVGPDELRACLGHETYFLDPQVPGESRVLLRYVAGQYLDNVERFVEQGESMIAAISMISSAYFLLAQHSWPEPVAQALAQTLAAVVGKPWREAALTLLSVAKQIATAYADAAADADPRDEGDAPGNPDTYAAHGGEAI